MKRTICVKVLPGEPTDGTGRVCIHLFVRDAAGPFTEPSAMHLDAEKKLAVGPARGRLACDPRRTVAPVVRGGVTTVTHRTDDPRAVTCPKCAASADYARIMGLINNPQPAGAAK